MIARGQGGKIINIASQAASIAIDNHLAYTSAKAGLLGMTKVMAKEWAPHRINVNTLSPTVVLTPMGEKAWRGEKGEEMKKLIPLDALPIPTKSPPRSCFCQQRQRHDHRRRPDDRRRFYHLVSAD